MVSQQGFKFLNWDRELKCYFRDRAHLVVSIQYRLLSQQGAIRGDGKLAQSHVVQHFVIRLQAQSHFPTTQVFDLKFLCHIRQGVAIPKAVFRLDFLFSCQKQGICLCLSAGGWLTLGKDHQGHQQDQGYNCISDHHFCLQGDVSVFPGRNAVFFVG